MNAGSSCTDSGREGERGGGRGGEDKQQFTLTLTLKHRRKNEREGEARKGCVNHPLIFWKRWRRGASGG